MHIVLLYNQVAITDSAGDLDVLNHARGIGLMAGVELLHRDGSPATAESIHILKRLLQRGFVFLPEGEHANVLSFTPPLTITQAQLKRSVRALGEELRRLE